MLAGTVVPGELVWKVGPIFVLAYMLAYARLWRLAKRLRGTSPGAASLPSTAAFFTGSAAFVYVWSDLHRSVGDRAFSITVAWVRGLQIGALAAVALMVAMT